MSMEFYSGRPIYQKAGADQDDRFDYRRFPYGEDAAGTKTS